MKDAKTRAVLHELETGEKVRLSQAERVIVKFGDATKLAKLINCDPSTVFKWTYTRDKQGSDGIIPSSAMKKVLKAARAEGIYLTPEDLWPGDR